MSSYCALCVQLYLHQSSLTEPSRIHFIFSPTSPIPSSQRIAEIDENIHEASLRLQISMNYFGISISPSNLYFPHIEQTKLTFLISEISRGILWQFRRLLPWGTVGQLEVDQTGCRNFVVGF
jgi:DUF1365 family protein